MKPFSLNNNSNLLQSEREVDQSNGNSGAVQMYIGRNQ